MKKELTNNRYGELERMSGFIAKKAGCDPGYVRQVLNGLRSPKSDRAKKAKKVLEVADTLLASFS